LHEKGFGRRNRWEPCGLLEMMEIVLATKNRDKIREIREVLKKVEFVSIEFPEVKEDGETLRENAVKKAETIASFTGKMALADDSGLEVKALGGKPGVRSARFAGEKVSYTENNRKLLDLMSNVGDREAKFRCVVALARPGSKTIVREGVCAGRIADKPYGRHGFGYDSVFIVKGYDKTFAELSPSFKNNISHRYKALQKLYKALLEIERMG